MRKYLSDIFRRYVACTPTEQRAAGPMYRYDQRRDVRKAPETVNNPLTVIIDFQEGDVARGH